jgi:hypothetical protein
MLSTELNGLIQQNYHRKIVANALMHPIATAEWFGLFCARLEKADD